MKVTSVLWVAFAALLSGCSVFEPAVEGGFVPGAPFPTPPGCEELRRREGRHAC